MDGWLTLLGALGALIVLDMAAWLWAVDSRDGFGGGERERRPNWPSTRR